MTVAADRGLDSGAGGKGRIRQRGLYFEEFELDTVYEHSPGRTISEADNTIFSLLTMNTQALHLDEEWSKLTDYGSRLVNSMFTLSTVVGSSVAQLTQGTIVANLGLTDVTFPIPVRVGDTIRSETTVLSKRLSRSRPDRGIVEFEHTALNQRGEIVATAKRTTMMQRIPRSE
jgi:acyl dehydratase